LSATRGREHPEMARCLNERAANLYQLGNEGESENLARRGYAIRLKALGKEHIDTAESVETLSAIGHADEVERTEKVTSYTSLDLMKLSIKVRENALGKDHIDLVPALLAVANERWDSREKQEPLVRRAMTLIQRAYG